MYKQYPVHIYDHNHFLLDLNFALIMHGSAGAWQLQLNLGMQAQIQSTLSDPKVQDMEWAAIWQEDKVLRATGCLFSTTYLTYETNKCMWLPKGRKGAGEGVEAVYF